MRKLLFLVAIAVVFLFSAKTYGSDWEITCHRNWLGLESCNITVTRNDPAPQPLPPPPPAVPPEPVNWCSNYGVEVVAARCCLGLIGTGVVHNFLGSVEQPRQGACFSGSYYNTCQDRDGNPVSGCSIRTGLDENGQYDITECVSVCPGWSRL